MILESFDPLLTNVCHLLTENIFKPDTCSEHCSAKKFGANFTRSTRLEWSSNESSPTISATASAPTTPHAILSTAAATNATPSTATS